MDDSKMNAEEVQLSRMKADKQQHIQVFVRLRPLNERERIKSPYSIVDCPGVREVVVKDRPNHTKTFTFDRVFNQQSKQIDVYKSVAAPLVQEVLLGYNCTVFAYGQTGTGKTYTMEGERSEETELSWEHDPLSGIVPRVLSQLFQDLKGQNAEFTVRVSLLELYNEELFDLLAPNEDKDKFKTLRLFEDSGRKGSVIIQGLEDITVHNKDEVYKIMERGAARRHTAATQMNANSSRSHTIFTITVHIKESNIEGEELVKIGKMNLVDLAGSESIGRSGAVNKHAREAGSINQSLLTLGRVITKLCEHAVHVPYRESKLTRLLQDSLGGRTKTSIIATISPSYENMEETLSTLEYAHRAKDITNKPEVNQKMTKRAVLKEYTEEIERLRRDLNACREKNGVYIANENYEKMVAEIEALKEELNMKALQGKSWEEASAKKDEALAASEAKLVETEEELSICNRLLQEKDALIEVTTTELQRVRMECEKQSTLVKHHVKTEDELSRQARTLLKTTEDATTNLENIYKKLDRKKQVEQQNLEAGNRTKEELVEGLEDICSGFEEYRTTQAELTANIRMTNQEATAAMEGKLVQVQQQVNELVVALSKILPVCQENTEILNNELGDHCRKTDNFVDNAVENLRKHAGKVTEFWEETYLVDNPTGATPQRKQYQFPRKLTCTSPHERILRRYLNGLKEEKEPENGDTEHDQDIL